MNVFAVRTEVDNWITDHLAQAVISYLPAAVGFEQSYISLPQLFLVEKYCGTITAAADRERVRMFEQQQRVGLTACFYGLFGLFLEREG